jgi:hypothetical protein
MSHTVALSGKNPIDLLKSFCYQEITTVRCTICLLSFGAQLHCPLGYILNAHILE